MGAEILTVLVALPFAAAFLASMVFGPGVIQMLRRRNVGQVISQDGPESHQSKAGTPTMGGLIIVGGIMAGVLAVLLASRHPQLAASADALTRGSDLAALMLLIVGFALVGMLDDHLTIHPRHGVRGFASKPKAAIQTLLVIAFVMWLATVRGAGFMPVLVIGGHQILSGYSYWVFAVVFMVGMVNFVNITDGLDGLVSGLTGIVASALVVCMMLIPGGANAEVDISLYALLPAIAGACVAFLWFNAHPAKVFMGDTGSMALGVALPAIAILTHREVLLIVVGAVFILDGLSSALQWAVFKFTRVTTGTGRRVFRKSPIHHHFELSGWPEQTVVVRFWIFGAAAALIGFAGAAWRIW